MKKQWHGRTGGGKLGQRALWLLMNYVNVRVLYAVLYVVVPFYMVINHKECRAICLYFKRRLHNSNFSAFINTYKTHVVFGKTLFDKFAIFAGHQRKFEINVEGREYFEDVLNSEGGAMIVSAHVGNFELGGYLLKQDRKPINAIVFGGEAATFQKYREDAWGDSIKAIAVKDDMSHIFEISKALANGEIITMLSDRAYDGSKALECSFFGAQARFPMGAFQIAQKFGLKVLVVFMVKTKGGSYTLFVRPIDGDKGECVVTNKKAEMMAMSFVSELEDVVRRYPNQWFNFYDFWSKS